MTDATVGYGATFEFGDGADPEVFADVMDEVTAIGSLSMSVDMQDATHTQSTEAFEEAVAGIIRTGTVQVTGNFDADGSDTTAMLAHLQSRAARNYKITFPDTTAWTFSALCSEMVVGDTPVNGLIPISYSVKITGKPTFFA